MEKMEYAFIPPIDIKFEKNSFYEDIFSSMEDLVRVIDDRGKVVYQNQPMNSKVGNRIGESCHGLFGSPLSCGDCICRNKVSGIGSVTKEVKLNGKVYSVVSALLKDYPGYCVEVFRDITKIKKHEEQIEDQNRRMIEDISFARQIQESLLPHNGVYSDMISFAGSYKPAEILGGDMFDIVEIDEDNIAFYIADVSGHGVTSSLVTMFISQTLKTVKGRADKPCDVLKLLMEKYMELGISDQKYFTMLYCSYNKSTKTINITNAGHNCLPILIKKEDGQMEEIDMVGIPICELYDYMGCTINEFTVDSGDRIIFYTDGISEASDSNKTYFADKINSVIEEVKDQPIEQITGQVIKKAVKHSGSDIKDDMAIMCIEFL